jgi:hypothetical protein
MLVTLAALHLLAFAQVETPASEMPAVDEVAQASDPSDAADADAQDAEAQDPEAQDPPELPPPADEPEPPRARATRTPVPAAPSRRQLSLLSAEPLGGGSMSMAWAGWSSIGGQWAMGVTSTDDLGLLLDFDWAGTELRLGGWYRRPLGTAGAFDMAGRLALSWYADFGGKFIHDGNHDDRGVALEPGLVFSVRGGGGIFSVAGDLPLTVTTYDDGGVLFAPRLSLAYETPLYPELNVGVIGGLGYRVGSGDAPMRDGRLDVRFLLVAGYQIL